MRFPLEKVPHQDYKKDPRRFGSRRDHGKRLHAGCDLYAAVGTPIYAVADGEVERYAYFYMGTYALEVKHGNFILRYGEVGKAAEGIKKGVSVKEGQVIAYVGKLTKLSVSMLHLEMYSGVDKNGRSVTGSLTDLKNPPYFRRSDLVDPTPFLDLWRHSFKILS
jgi:murein DD-endopeptidase MepM/ murein hydrolase activator NlpD